MIFNKKAAMFGLDARIALAIFGALSVITGAALFSAIKTAKATTYLTHMSELGKAWESYYVDTGDNLPFSDATTLHSLNTRTLIEDSGNPGWKGPYVDTSFYKLYPWAGDPRLIPPRIDPSLAAHAQFRFLNYRETWTTAYSQVCSNASLECGVWVSYEGFPDDSIFNEMDRIVDGGDGPLKGNMRKLNNFAYLHLTKLFNPRQPT